jgi:5,10-methylene-tetrahydrofolate dehydrogenase/methenyl tetrahydrofolate cyclohydrolase
VHGILVQLPLPRVSVQLSWLYWVVYVTPRIEI